MLLTLLIGLFLTSTLPAQIQDEVSKQLAAKDFVTFKKYADSLVRLEHRINAYWEFLRDVTADIQEGVFTFEQTAADKDNPAISRVYTFRVNLLTTKTTIIYYKLSEEKIKKEEGGLVSYYKPIEKFKNDSAYTIFKKSFKETYQADLNEKDLFLTGFVYGTNCGIAGTRTAGRAQMDEWVEAKNKVEIVKWLKSANTEKQLYAVDGLRELEKAGIKLTEEEKRIVDFVCNKNGTVYVCSGCIHSRQDIQEMININTKRRNKL